MKKFFGKFSKTFILMGIMAGAFCMGEVKAAMPSDEIIAKKIESAAKNNLKNIKLFWEVVSKVKKNAPTASFEELEKIYGEEVKAAGLTVAPNTIKDSVLRIWILFEKVQTKEEAVNLLELARKVNSVKGVLKLVPLAKLSDKEALKIYSELSEKIITPSSAREVFKQIKPLLSKVEEAEAKEVLKKLNRTWSGYLVTQKGRDWDKVIAQIRTILETY